jgi:hypothetical protein
MFSLSKKIIYPLIFVLFFNIGTVHAVETTGLTNYWRFDESSGNASDEVGGNTLINNGSVGYSTGLINNASNFTNSNSQYFTNDALSFGTKGSMSFFVNINGGDNGGYFIDSSASARFYFIYASDGAVNISINGASLNAPIGTIPFGGWSHVVLTWDSSLSTNKIKLYVDNNLEATSNNSVSSFSPSDTYFANRYVNTGTQDALNGRFDELSLWNIALTSGDISDIYNSGNGLSYPFTPPEPEPEPTPSIVIETNDIRSYLIHTMLGALLIGWLLGIIYMFFR